MKTIKKSFTSLYQKVAQHIATMVAFSHEVTIVMSETCAGCHLCLAFYAPQYGRLANWHINQSPLLLTEVYEAAALPSPITRFDEYAFVLPTSKKELQQKVAQATRQYLDNCQKLDSFLLLHEDKYNYVAKAAATMLPPQTTPQEVWEEELPF